MYRIRFADDAAHGAYQCMVEGMAENAADDGDTARVALFDRIAEAIAPDSEYPATYRIEPALYALARDVLENCEDGAPDYIAGAAKLDYSQSADMDSREALEVALQALEDKCAETDTASPEGHLARLAVDVVRSMLEQRGCEDFDCGPRDGYLTSVMDVVIFG